MNEPSPPLSYYVYHSQAAGVFSPEERVFAGTESSAVLELPGDNPGAYHFAVQSMDSEGNLSSLATPLPQALVTGPGAGAGSSDTVRVFRIKGRNLLYRAFAAYDRQPGTYGLKVACGNLLGLGCEQVVTAPGPGLLGPEIRVTDGYGTPVTDAPLFAFSDTQKGANVACGDLDGDGIDELVVGAGSDPDTGPTVAVFHLDDSGLALDEVFRFQAYPESQGYGVNVACGDVNGDGIDEIVTGCGPGQTCGPRVRVFTISDAAPIPLAEADFLAYGIGSMGVNVACGDVDGDGYDEILTGPGPGRGCEPRVRVFDLDGVSGPPIPGVEFLAYPVAHYGVVVRAEDVDCDHVAEIITAPGPGPSYPALIKGFRVTDGNVSFIKSFRPHDGLGDDAFGVNFAIGRLFPAP